jgi:hypothetical protein
MFTPLRLLPSTPVELNRGLTINGVDNDLNPVAIRISDKGNIVHSSFLEFLDECNSFLLETLTCLLEIIDGNTDMAKASWFFVTVSVGKIGISLGTVIAVKWIVISQGE